jgi:hypothetical protein
VESEEGCLEHHFNDKQLVGQQAFPSTAEKHIWTAHLAHCLTAKWMGALVLKPNEICIKVKLIFQMTRHTKKCELFISYKLIA